MNFRIFSGDYLYHYFFTVSRDSGRWQGGFTFLELVLACIVLIVMTGLAVREFSGSVMKAKEKALQENLRLIRQAIDEYRKDHAQYPANLFVLTPDGSEKGYYLRFIPRDPVTEKMDWIIIDENGMKHPLFPTDAYTSTFDVRSAASGYSGF